MAAKKEVKKRNRKPGLKSTDGMPKVKPAYKKKNVLKGKRLIDYNPSSEEYKILDRGGLEGLFKTPESLWNAAVKYFTWVKDNPWYKNEYRDGMIVKIPAGRPMTIIGMCVHMGVGSDYYRHFKQEMSEEKRQLFGPVINAIDNTIYTQKFEGASIGAFNATIISRDLGLIDKVDTTTNGKDIVAQPPQINVYNNAPKMAGSESEVDQTPTVKRKA